MKKYKALILILTASVLFTACSEKEPEMKNDNVGDKDDIIVTAKQFEVAGMKLGKITQQNFSERVRVTGRIDVPPEYKADVSVYYGGSVKKIHLLPGQKVEKGETLFTLENPDYVEMQQNYLIAKSKLGYLKSEYERQKELLSENVSSQKKFAKAEADYFSVLADFNALDKKLRLLNINPENLNVNAIRTYSAIKAPISGYVTAVNITRGEYISPNEVAVSIISTKHLHLELNVFEKDILKIKKGQKIRFTFPDNNSSYYEAEVFLVGKSVDESDKTINVHGHLVNDKDAVNFVPGMYVEAEILVDEILKPALPSDAVVNVDDVNYVLVKKSYDNGEYIFRKEKVKIGLSNDGYTEILNADDFGTKEIVVKGAFNLIQ